jgi:hypothetical protein
LLAQNPCRHIAEILLKKSEEMGESPSAKGRISLDGPALETAADKVAESSKKTAFAAGATRAPLAGSVARGLALAALYFLVLPTLPPP